MKKPSFVTATFIALIVFILGLIVSFEELQLGQFLATVMIFSGILALTLIFIVLASKYYCEKSKG